MVKHRRFGPTYRRKIIPSSMRKHSTAYSDYLGTLNDKELQIEYRRVYSSRGESTRKLILNKFLLKNNKLDIIR